MIKNLLVALFAFAVVRAAHATPECELALFTVAVNVQTEYVEFEGVPIDEVTPAPGHSRGRNHSGLFRARYLGAPVLLKLTNEDTFAEARRATPGIHVGGPQIYGVARFVRPGDQIDHFVVMEELFPGEESFTLQGLFEASSERREAGIRTLLAGPARTRLTRQLADWVANGYLHDVLPPVDLDFIFTADRLRLIDVGSIGVGRRRPGTWEQMHAACTMAIVAGMLDSILGAEVRRAFVADYLAAMRAVITDDDAFEVVRAHVNADAREENLLSMLRAY